MALLLDIGAMPCWACCFLDGRLGSADGQACWCYALSGGVCRILTKDEGGGIQQ